jgi:hypothetical protein
MAQRFLTSINLSSNELQNALLHPLATAPAVGPAGKVYYNTTEDILYVSDGTVWRSVSGDITSIIAGTGITVSGTTGDVTVNLANTAVTPGSYGSATQIPTFTVDQQGRLTAAGTASISTDLDIAGDTGTDTISLSTETLTFTGGDGITTSVAANAVTLDVDSTVVRTSGDQTIAGNKTFSNNVIINGDLTVSGNMVTKLSENVLIEDNIIVLNSNETGAPTEDAGIEINRGTDPNISLIWNETTDKWQIETATTVYQNIATENYVNTQIGNNSFAASIGDGTNTSYTVTHNFNSKDVIVQLYDNSTFDTVYADVVRDTVNTVVVTFTVAPTTNDIRVLITKVA